jgi:CTP synthase
VVGLMTEWIKGNQVEKRDAAGDLGGTMRLGAYAAHLRAGTKVHEIYGQDVISERHRHRYEVNPKFRARFEEAGLMSSGTSPDRRLVEFIELRDHPYWVATQNGWSASSMNSTRRLSGDVPLHTKPASSKRDLYFGLNS